MSLNGFKDEDKIKAKLQTQIEEKATTCTYYTSDRIVNDFQELLTINPFRKKAGANKFFSCCDLKETYKFGVISNHDL